MTTRTFNPDKPVALYPLTYLEQDDEVTVGRADIDSYGMFPADGAALLRRLEAGASPNEAARWYTDTYHEVVDIVEFLDVLTEFDFLVRDGEVITAPRPLRWQRLGRTLFSPVAWICYGIVVAAAGVAMIRDKELVPSYQHIFFTSSLVAVTLGIFFGQVPWVFLHEAYHALAGRRLGLRSTLGVGRRFYYIVFETSLDGLVSVPRRKRYLPMLAGIVADVVAIAALTLGAAAMQSVSGPLVVIPRFLLAMAFGVVLRVAWQSFFFLRTDLYYLVTTVLGCNDLQTVARGLLRNRVSRVLPWFGNTADESSWHPRDRAVARWYVWLMVAGYVLLVGTVAFVALPAAIEFTQLTLQKMIGDPTPISLLDGAGFLVLNFWEPVLAAWLAILSYRRRRMAGRFPVTIEPQPRKVL
jgi:hypothetical protein